MRIVVLSEPIQYKGISNSGHEITANIVPVAGAVNRDSRRPCPMAAKNGQGFSISEVFRHALGMTSNEHHTSRIGQVDQVAPVAGSSVGVTFDPKTMEGHTKGGDRIKIVAPTRIHNHSGDKDRPMVRLHKALMMLGPWEGRAVAFVLGQCRHLPVHIDAHTTFPGCGLGVLLRIAFLALLLTYRAISGTGQQEEETEEEYLVPPPIFNFQYVDEKQPILFEDDVPEYEVLEEEQAKN